MVTIRKIEEEDYPQMERLFAEFANYEGRSDQMKNSLQRMQEEKDFFCAYVAENEAREIVGYAAYFFCYFTWTGKSMYMDDLYITQSYRKQGLGTRLINRVIELAKESKCHRLRWQVSSWNEPAISFYKKIGAKIDSEDHNCDLMLE